VNELGIGLVVFEIIFFGFKIGSTKSKRRDVDSLSGMFSIDFASGRIDEKKYTARCLLPICSFLLECEIVPKLSTKSLSVLVDIS